jgi:hypothetical protein
MEDEHKDWLPPTLRTIALVVIALCGVAVVFGMFPGTKVYKDANDCFGHALGALFSAHGGGHSTCESHYILVRTESAGGWQGALALTPIVLGAMVLRRWPRPLIAFLWPMGGFVLLAIGFIVTFKLEIFSLEHKVALWPTYVVSAMLGLIFLIMTALFLGSPIVGIVRWRARRRAARERIPEARVV